nr:hypothetical protein [Tanacetum cinerariifolium]
MSSFASFFLCSCLLAPRRENTLVERDDAYDEDLLLCSFLFLSSDPNREKTLLDRDRDVNFYTYLCFPPLLLFLFCEAHVLRTHLCACPTDGAT